MCQSAQTLLQIAVSLTKIKQQIRFNKVYKVLETVAIFCTKAYLVAQKLRKFKFLGIKPCLPFASI